MGQLTTHVLDTANGRPAAGVTITLRCGGQVVCCAQTNKDGRCEAPLLQGEGMRPGVYELAFAVGDYFDLPQPRFLDEVVLRFGIACQDQHLHVPLLVTPWGYTCYRGS